MTSNVAATGPSRRNTPGLKKILSLDGGGVKGISSLLILKAIMEKVAKLEGRNKDIERLPFDYFDLAAGTSTGGLIALMLFRLRMSTSDTIKVYEKLAQEIFSPTFFGFNLDRLGRLGYWFGNFWLMVKILALPAKFSEKPLERAIDAVVAKYGKEPGDKDEKGKALLRKGPGKMFMCATLAYKGESILLRSYIPPPDSFPATRVPLGADAGINIADAARATSAPPTYLPALEIEDTTFWDGGLLNNNPINQAWDARFDLATDVTETPIIRCILSIGASYCDDPPHSWWRFLNTVSQAASYVTNTEAKHQDFECNVRKLNYRQRNPDYETQYFRFNAKTAKSIDLDDWQEMAGLKVVTNEYLKEEEWKQPLGAVPSY